MLRLLLIVMPFIEGCATIVSGTEKDVLLDVSPHDSVISIDGRRYSAQTYARLSVLADHVMHVAADAHCTESVLIRRKLNAWVLGDLFLAVIPGIVIDIASGAVHTLPGVVRIALRMDSECRSHQDLGDPLSRSLPVRPVDLVQLE